ncbi:hypothetical protein AX14_011286 [Amanita brunnescens Koide BX004]|nr:hypothetical protein AX14_011286 [Amanita brunnescens Koide BX004]
MCSLGVEDELLEEAVEIHKCSDERYPKDLELAQRVPDSFKPPNAANAQFQQPGQEAVGNEGPSVQLHSRESATAHMPHTPVPAGPFLAYFPLPSSPKLEFWLCRKPPNNGGNSMRHAYRAISDTPQPSAMKCSPPNGMHPIPSLTDPTHEEHPSCPNKELVARVRKPPDVTGRWLLLEAVNKIKGG